MASVPRPSHQSPCPVVLQILHDSLCFTDPTGHRAQWLFPPQLPPRELPSPKKWPQLTGTHDENHRAACQEGCPTDPDQVTRLWPWVLAVLRKQPTL